MNRSVRVLVGLVVLLTLLSAAGCTKLRARDQLNKGVQSYKNARYEEAINHFKQAVELDPSTDQRARLPGHGLYAQQYVPGADTEDNLRMANSAIEQYKKVLEADPKNINSVKGIAYLYLQMKKFDDAKTWYRKAIRCRSERSRSLLFGWRDRLDAGVPAPHGRILKAGPEA